MNRTNPSPEDEGDAADQRSCFWFRGDDNASSGTYRPASYGLRFQGHNIAQHHVMHLHEIHHKVLNDDTAWGAMIHIAARHPGWDSTLLDALLDRCRRIHEAFASFMADSLAGQRHPDVGLVLDSYPVYKPLVQRMNRLLAPVPPGHRREIAATGIARFCMSSPILDLALAAYPEQLALSDIPSFWIPDQRFIRVSLSSRESILGAVQSADAGFVTVCGQPLDSLTLHETDEELDEAWATWESLFIDKLIASEARLQALPLLASDTHLVSAAHLVEAAASRGLGIALPHDPGHEAITDAESVQRLLAAMEIELRDSPLSAALADVGVDVDVEDLLHLAAASDNPALVVHASLPRHLLGTFSWGPKDRDFLQSANTPLFALRLLVEDSGKDIILNATLRTPEDYVSLTQPWPPENLIANCVAASCYTQSSWQQVWPAVLSGNPTVILLDLGAVGLVGHGKLLGSSQPVYGAYIGLGMPELKALTLRVEGHPHVLLVLGDDLTIQLFAGQLEDLLGERLRMHDADWSPWLRTLAAVCGSILGTERSLRFDGGERL